MLALLEHARHLETAYGVGPHTISVPRLTPAVGAGDVAAHPPAPVSDADFLKLVAVAAPGRPLHGDHHEHARETAAHARGHLRPWASRRSAPRAAPIRAAMPRGRVRRTRPNPCAAGQFQLGDHRSLEEVVADVLKLG